MWRYGWIAFAMVLNGDHAKQETKIQIADVRELVKIADFENRIPKNSWWLNSIRPLCKTMAGHK